MNFKKSKIFLILSIIIVNLIVINVSLGQSTNNTGTNRQKMSIENLPSQKPIRKFIWPLSSYTKAQNFIKSDNPEQAIKLLEEEMSGNFPFQFPATNGYKIYFFYYKLLGDAYAAANKPVEAIDTYRSALAIPYSTITNSPVPYAKGLQSLALQFRKIGRLIDAENILHSASGLVDDKRILSDIHFTRCLQAARILDIDAAAQEADKCIEIDPDYNTKAFHFVALKEFKNKNYKKAIDYWLLGLNGMPVEKVIKYLDSSQMFWKKINDEQIYQYYDILTSLLTRVSPDQPKSTARILKERIKLQKLYPEYFEEDNPADTLKRGEKLADLFCKVKSSEIESSTPKKKPVLRINESILETNEAKREINLIFYHLLKLKMNANDISPYRRQLKIKELNDKLLQKKYLSTNTTIKIDDWNIWFEINFLRVILDKKRCSSTDKSRAVAFQCKTNCLKMVERGMAGNGDPRDLIFLYQEQLQQYVRHRKKDDALETIYNIESIAKNSELISKAKIAVNLTGETNIQTILNSYQQVIDLPSTYPEGKMWKNLSDIYFRISKMKTSTKEKEKTFNKAVDLLFDGLERSVVPSSNENEKFTSERWGLQSNPLISKILELEKAGELNNDNYEKLKTFFHKYGMCIPAKDSQTDIIKEIIDWKNKLNKERDKEIELVINCDASPWKNKKQVWLWADVLNQPQLMKQIVENQFTTTIIVVCNAQKLSNVKNVYIIGNTDELGKWRKPISMSDDGKTHSDKKEGDKIFTYSFAAKPEIKKLEYLFLTDESGEWDQGQPEYFRNYTIPDSSEVTNIIHNQYGKKIR